MFTDIHPMTIEELRERIEMTDYQILELIEKRLELAEEIGSIKKNIGQPLKNPDIEIKVIERYREFASSNNIDPDAAERIARILIEEALRRE